MLEPEAPVVNIGDSRSARPDSLPVLSGVGDDDIFITGMPAVANSIEGDQLIRDLGCMLTIPACEVHAGIAQWKHQPLEISADGLKEFSSYRC